MTDGADDPDARPDAPDADAVDPEASTDATDPVDPGEEPDAPSTADGDADSDSDSDSDSDGDGDSDSDSDGHGDGDGDGATAPARPRRRRGGLDARILVICVLIALIAALIAGLVTSKVIEDDEPAVGDSSLSVAQEVPDTPLERLSDGSEVSLADYRGQALVVNFWGSWCAPCIEEMPDLQRVQESLGDDVTFIGVNIRDQPDKAQELAEETGVTYELVRDTDGVLLRELGITIFPTTLLVRPDGTVIDSIQSRVTSDRLCEKINQNLLGGALTECG